MKKLKRQGFTLLELLAVIVVLAVIALIATPLIMKIIESSRKSAVESSAIGYIDAIEKQIMVNTMDDDTANDIPNGTHTVSTLNTTYGVKVKGTSPDSGSVTIANSKVESATLVINGYNVTCTENSCHVTKKTDDTNTTNETENNSASTSQIPSCPDCVFADTQEEWHYSGSNVTRLTDSSLYKEDYRELINLTGYDYFLGLKLNKTTKAIEKAYVCGILNAGEANEKVFCVQGHTNGDLYPAHKSLLANETTGIFGPYDDEEEKGCKFSDNGSQMWCYGTIDLYANNSGNVRIGPYGGYCAVFSDGKLFCY